MSGLIIKTRGFFTRSRRLLRHARKPSNRELSISAKITGVGIIVIGFLGYVLHYVFNTIISAIQG